MSAEPIHARYGIVGFGIAGQILTLELLQRGIPPTEILLIDETFMGGALALDYDTVLSNTPWWKTRKALEIYGAPAQEALARGDALYRTDQCMPVSDIAKLCAAAATAAAFKVPRLRTRISEFQRISGKWILTHPFGTVQVNTLFLCHGGLAKTMDLPIPMIPLTTALNRSLLATHIDPATDYVVVFGTAHSGVILLEHLHTLGVSTTAIYNTPQPFLFERDGAYDGVKEATATTADAILRGEFPKLSLVSWSDPLAVHKALSKATKVIYSIGFVAAPLPGFTSLKYDPATAALTEAEQCYGYGIAFPGVTILEGRTYTDVSVLSFQDQIRRTLPNILTQ